MNKDKINPKRFVKFRDKLSLTQQEAANLFGVSLRAWQDWEYGLFMPNDHHFVLLKEYEENPPKLTTVAQMCQFIRKKLGLKKMDMAEMFNVRLNTWGYWERGVMKPIGEHRERIEKMFKEMQQQETLEKAS